LILEQGGGLGGGGRTESLGWEGVGRQKRRIGEERGLRKAVRRGKTVIAGTFCEVELIWENPKSQKKGGGF